MNEQRLIKNLTIEQQTEILNFILDKFNLENNELAKKFYNAMIIYIKNVRRSVTTFERNVVEIIELFSNCCYTNDQIMEILIEEPSLLHSDKNDIFWRILILGKVNDSKTGTSSRETYLIQNPRILRISQDVMYARIKYLESDVGRQYLRKDGPLTIRQIIKVTHKEFQDSYGVSKDMLLYMYPFNSEAQLDVISWEENKKLLDAIYGRSV